MKPTARWAASMKEPSPLERVLLGGVWTGLVLILLTPFVISPQTIFPWVVGKALYSRALIEIVFALWMLLALARPAYRPPRSWLLALLGAVLAAGLLSALLGVSRQRSLWSDYERMGGIVDSAHWFALALVLTSTLRSFAHWRLLLSLNLGVSLGLALLAVGQGQGLLQTPLLAWHQGKVAATLGNELFLGAYAVLNALMALGFLFHSLANGRMPAASPSSAGERRSPWLWPMRAFWTSAALLNLWAFTLTGSRGALLGLLAGLGFVVLLLAFLGRKRWRRLAAATTSLLLAGTLLLLAVLFLRPGVWTPDVAFANPFLDSLTNSVHQKTVRMRMAVWAAGLQGFGDRPVTGWGPGNYDRIFGRYAIAENMALPIHDHAHSQLLEEAATKGLLGFITYLALWAFTLYAVLRILKAAGAKERIPLLFLGAALAAHFVQSQTSVDSAVGTLQHTLMFACLASFEAERNGRMTWAAPVLARLRLGSALWRGPARALLAVAALSLAGLGLSQNHGIHKGARAVWNSVAVAQTPEQAVGHLRQAIAAFAPLANGPRRILFDNAASLWPIVQAGDADSAARTLALVEAEAAAALRSEPDDWRLRNALANFYLAASDFDPAYQEKATEHLAAALTLAPNVGSVAVMPVPPMPKK